MPSTYLDSRRRPNPFLEISESTKQYIGFQLKEQATNGNVNKVEFDNIVTFWTTLTKVSDVIDNGKRLENISWRLVNRKLLLKNELSYKDVSTVIEVAKGLECKELKSNLHRRKLNRRIQKSNNKMTASNKEKANRVQIPNLFNKSNIKSNDNYNDNVNNNKNNNNVKNNSNNNSSVSPKKNCSNNCKDNNGRKTKFFINMSSPDSSSMSPPIRTQSSENIEKVLKGSNQSLIMSSESEIAQNAPFSHKTNITIDKHKETVQQKDDINTAKSHAHQILQSHNHTHQHVFNNNVVHHHHHHNHSHLNQHYNTTSHTSTGQTQQQILSNLNPQKRLTSEKNGPPSLFKNTSQVHKNQTQNTILLNSRSSSQPTSVKQNQVQIKGLNKNTAQHNPNHINKSSLFSFKPKAKQTVSASPDIKRDKINKDTIDDDDDDYGDDFSESEDDSSGWSSLSDDDEDYDEDDELRFEKQNVVAPEINTRPVLKRSLLSGLFLDEMDKSDSSKEKDSAPTSRHEHYDLHHKSNAPLTAQTLLPTALTTHIFLPTKNFTTFQNAQRHQYSGQRTNGVPGSRSPIVPSQSQENMLQLTRDNVAKFTKDEMPTKKSYAASIHTTTSSIDIPGWEIKKMRELRRDERKIEKEAEGDELPVHLIDSLQNENKFLLDDNIDTGFVDDKILKKATSNYVETDDDFNNYHAKGW